MRHRSCLSRRLAVATFALLSLAALHLGAGALSGCGATTGKRITLETRVVAEEGITAPFVNEYGWSVKLTTARLSIGALYYFAGPPVVASLPSRPRLDWRSILAVPAAHAHPGHYTEGDALGQMLVPQTVELTTESALSDGEAVTGHYESARFSFESPPQGDLAAEMGGQVVLVEGEATKDGAVLRFRATAGEADILNADGNPFVEGCVFDVADVEESGTVTLAVHPAVWLDQVDFAEVPDDLDADRAILPPGESPHEAFVRGLQKGTAYDFSYSAN
jgi:hypothetical protein